MLGFRLRVGSIARESGSLVSLTCTHPNPPGAERELLNQLCSYLRRELQVGKCGVYWAVAVSGLGWGGSS